MRKLKKILLFTSSAQTAAPIVTALEHPQVLCSGVTVLLEIVGAAERGTPDVDHPRRAGAERLHPSSATQRPVPMRRMSRSSPSAGHTQTQHRLDEFIDSDRIETDLRPLVLKKLGLADPAPATPPNAEPAIASA
jgi:hypothetical protein